MDWQASWIWHPARAGMDNFYLYARKPLILRQPPHDAQLFITASSLYKLYINGAYVGRGPNPTDPCRYYYDARDVTAHLRAGENVLAVIAYNYGPETRGILGQNWGRGGLLVELRAPLQARRAPGEDGCAIIVTSDRNATAGTRYADRNSASAARERIERSDEGRK